MSPGTAVPHYIDLRFPDGTHTGVRVDWARGIVEIRRRGVNYYFDIADADHPRTLPAKPERYDFNK